MLLIAPCKPTIRNKLKSTKVNNNPLLRVLLSRLQHLIDQVLVSNRYLGGSEISAPVL